MSFRPFSVGYRLHLGSPDADTLDGYSGNDRFIGGGGDDTVDGGAGTDIAVYCRLRSDYQISRQPDGSRLVADLRPGSPDGTDTLTNVEFLQFSDQVFDLTTDHAPVVTATHVTFDHGLSSLAASSLFTVQDADDDPITQYRFWDGTADVASGHFAVNGVAQGANQYVTVTASQLAQTTFEAGTVADQLWVQASDGLAWGAWTIFNLDPPPNIAPVVTASDVLLPHGTSSIQVSALFTTTDADNDPITQYRFWDNTLDPASGHLLVNGVVQNALGYVDVLATQLPQVSFQVGSIADDLWVQAYDGFGFGSWTHFTVSPPPNQAPVVTASDQTVGPLVAASSLFVASDPDNDPIIGYRFWDGTANAASGHFVLNGVAQAANQYIVVLASQLSQLTFEAGTLADQLWVQADDGTDRGAWAVFTVTPALGGHTGALPIVTASDQTLPHGVTSVDLSTLFTVSDADNDPITQYRLWDNAADAASGHLVLNGIALDAHQYADLSAAQLAATTYQAGTAADELWIQASDGSGFGPFAHFTVSPPPDQAPVVTATHYFPGQLVEASTLFTASDADNDTITQYRLWDDTASPYSGHFILDGVTQAAEHYITISASQLPELTYEGGTLSDLLMVQANDGFGWGAWAALEPPVVEVGFIGRPPDVVAADQTLPHGETSVAASSLFTISNPDNDPIIGYRFWDGSSDPSSGHFVVNGVVQDANQYITLIPAQLAQATFEAGTATDQLWVQVDYGPGWGSWTVFSVNPPPNQTPVVTGSDASLPLNSAIAASDLFSANDPDGDPITKYEFWDTPGTNAHLVVNGVGQAYNQPIDVLAAELDQATFVAGSSPGADLLYARAFDGTAWGDWHMLTVTSHA